MSVILQYMKLSETKRTRTDEAAISTYEQNRYKNWGKASHLLSATVRGPPALRAVRSTRPRQSATAV